MSPSRRRWFVGGAILIVLAVISSVAAPESQVAEVLLVVSVLWLLATAWLLGWWLWRWMTYRVGVRLFLTYLLVGVLPLMFATAFAAVGLYILMGQYTSVRVGSEFDRFYWTLGGEGAIVLTAARAEGVEAAVSDLEKFHLDPPDPLTRVLWRAHLGDRDIALTDEEFRPDLGWLPEGLSFWVAHHQDQVFGVTANRAANGDWVASMIPFDDVTATDLSSQWWFDVAFINEGMNDREADSIAESGDTIQGGDAPDALEGEGSVRISLGGETVSGQAIWPKWSGSDDGLFSKPIVVWFRMVTEVVELETGEPIEDGQSVALLRTSPKNAWDDFTLSKYELRNELYGVLAGLAALLLVGCGLVLGAAAAVIMSIARSTARLSNGAREVERGNLDYRVPVKRRDQLGDLAQSFNHMTASVQSMVAAVAEKEHLAHELELAREIQESLLPARFVEVGPLTVRATFQPAAEVGGDYFDIFPLADNRLVVAIGDVAGHGLSTGLLMASLKSSVAALVHEGYRGGDLIAKVNGLLMEHGQRRTLVTLAVIEIDLVAGRLEIANAGHPPAFLLAPEGGAEELLAGSMPMGSRLCRPVIITHPFPVGSRLLLYSDGLVEAWSPDGEPFGYQRLEQSLERAPDHGGDRLTAVILEALAEFTEGNEAADDLTVLVVERTG